MNTTRREKLKPCLGLSSGRLRLLGACIIGMGLDGLDGLDPFFFLFSFLFLFLLLSSHPLDLNFSHFRRLFARHAIQFKEA